MLSNHGTDSPSQTYLDQDMQPPRIEEIEQAAREFRSMLNDRKALTTRESDAHDKVLKLMIEHDIDEYRYGNDLFLRSRGNEKIKVKRVKDDGDEQ